MGKYLHFLTRYTVNKMKTMRHSVVEVKIGGNVKSGEGVLLCDIFGRHFEEVQGGDDEKERWKIQGESVVCLK